MLSWKTLRLALLILILGTAAIWFVIWLTTHEGLWQTDPDFHPFSTPTPAPPPDPNFGTVQ